MISDKFKDWWRKHDDVEKLKLISKKAIELKSISLRRKKALDAELDFGLNRTGLRGGKFTSLSAKSQNLTKCYLDAIEELKYMTLSL